MDLKIFVICDDDIWLAWWIERDVAERGRTLDSVLKQYLLTVKPSYDQFIKPTIDYSDLIIPGTPEN